MTVTQRYSAALLATVLCAGLAATASAQTARMWNWYAEIVSIDQARKEITVKAQMTPAVATYLNKFKAGDRVVLVWRIDGAKGGETDTVLLVATPDEMSIVDVGYITRVDFVAGDAAAKTLTFKTVVPDNVLAPIAAAQPGSWIKVTAPMEQPGTGVVLTAAAPSTKPNLPAPAAAAAPPAAAAPAAPKPKP